MSTDRRGFLGRAMGLAGLVAVGSLIVPKAYVWPSEELPEAGKPPSLYLPNKPAIVAATSVGRPVLEGTLRGFNLQTNFHRLDVTSYDRPVGDFIAPLDYETEIVGRLSDVTVHYAMHSALMTKKLKMYLVMEED